MELLHPITGDPIPYRPHKELRCEACGVPHPSFSDKRRKYCSHCGYERLKKSWAGWRVTEKSKKHDAVRRITKAAVRGGFLQDPRQLDCMDCGNPAECYDHRDYNKPLDVEPVCISCNGSRGAGIPLDRPLFENNR